VRPGWIPADWPAPPGVHGGTTTRAGGVSEGPYASLNLGDRVGDDPARVAGNRALLRASLGLPAEPLWLRQVHGCGLGEVAGCEADASIARGPGRVCAVLSADCLPVLLCDRAGTVVAAAHAGWRGLAAGILERTVRAMGVRPDDLLAWLGPAIGPDAFEVGPEVRAAFVAADPDAAPAFRHSRRERWWADLYALARRRLERAGTGTVSGGGFCTHTDAQRFFSYRRAPVCGRMATLIWLDGGETSE